MQSFITKLLPKCVQTCKRTGKGYLPHFLAVLLSSTQTVTHTAHSIAPGFVHLQRDFGRKHVVSSSLWRTLPAADALRTLLHWSTSAAAQQLPPYRSAPPCACVRQASWHRRGAAMNRMQPAVRAALLAVSLFVLRGAGAQTTSLAALAQGQALGARPAADAAGAQQPDGPPQNPPQGPPRDPAPQNAAPQGPPQNPPPLPQAFVALLRSIGGPAPPAAPPPGPGPGQGPAPAPAPQAPEANPGQSLGPATGAGGAAPQPSPEGAAPQPGAAAALEAVAARAPAAAGALPVPGDSVASGTAGGLLPGAAAAPSPGGLAPALPLAPGFAPGQVGVSLHGQRAVFISGAFAAGARACLHMHQKAC